MDISFALLMIVGCILGVFAFIEAEKCSHYKYEIRRKDEKLAEYHRKQQYDQEYSAQLTLEAVADAIRANGYVPTIEENFVSFKIQGEIITAYTDRLPLVTLAMHFLFDAREYDLDLLLEACRRATESMILVKAGLKEQDGFITFQIGALENCFGSFNASFGRYVGILFDAVDLSLRYYEELAKAYQKPGATMS